MRNTCANALNKPRWVKVMIFRPAKTKRLVAESVTATPGSHLIRSLSRGALAAACACCATGLLPVPALAARAEEPAWTLYDPNSKFDQAGAALPGIVGLGVLVAAAGPSRPLHQRLDAAAAAIESKMIA